jgi:hypothetical protein
MSETRYTCSDYRQLADGGHESTTLPGVILDLSTVFPQ